jgi:hypothetical protein
MHRLGEIRRKTRKVRAIVAICKSDLASPVKDAVAFLADNL